MLRPSTSVNLSINWYLIKNWYQKEDFVDISVKESFDMEWNWQRESRTNVWKTLEYDKLTWVTFSFLQSVEKAQKFRIWFRKFSGRNALNIPDPKELRVNECSPDHWTVALVARKSERIRNAVVEQFPTKTMKQWALLKSMDTPEGSISSFQHPIEPSSE